MRLRFLFAMFLIAFCADISGSQANSGLKNRWSGTVSHVSDGDTLWVSPAGNGAPRKIRVDGIDAPEMCQAHGQAARDALARHVLGKTVQVATRRRDDYGRALAKLSLQGDDVGEWMVAQGHAWSHRYRRDSGPYAAQEAQARSGRRGLFGDGQAERPRDFRKRHGPCH